MAPIMYSHRLKSVLQHSVRELGLTVVLDDGRSEVSLSENEAMIRETASLLGIQVHFEPNESSVSVTFYQ
ncbi:hypothetical protein GCM10007385_09180 [Tateyamaria omphalii]|uniref:hypothetical protein n=1 Tax=Tateyamaria omphalii TaxID=299262 RepID=UPI00167B0300|nr:hypothetical protein [Tateyamaria omphalii]GGX43430.1 hypothetical protein GCM10007385_09180 [Tateyamaria omphalii]